MTPII